MTTYWLNGEETGETNKLLPKSKDNSFDNADKIHDQGGAQRFSNSKSTSNLNSNSFNENRDVPNSVVIHHGSNSRLNAPSTHQDSNSISPSFLKKSYSSSTNRNYSLAESAA